MLGNIPAPCTHQAALPHKHCAGACSVCSLCQALLHKDRALRSSYPCITLSTATYKPAWKCQACSIFRDNYPELFGHHDGTMVQFMWKAGPTWGCHVCHRLSWAYVMPLTPRGVGHLISPGWLGKMWCFSLCLSPFEAHSQFCLSRRHAGPGRSGAALSVCAPGLASGLGAPGSVRAGRPLQRPPLHRHGPAGLVLLSIMHAVCFGEHTCWGVCSMSQSALRFCVKSCQHIAQVLEPPCTTLQDNRSLPGLLPLPPCVLCTRLSTTKPV